MHVKIGLVGLPNVGKSTLFNILTNKNVKAENYPFCTKYPNSGLFIIDDERIEKLRKIDSPRKIVKPELEILDIAGLVKGANKGEGLGNQFLAHIREVDLIVHVVRFFKNINITHVENRIDPADDTEIINLELRLKDLESIENGIKKIKQNETKKIALLEKIRNALLANKDVRTLNFNEEEFIIVKEFQLLTLKPVVYIGNCDDEIDKNLAEEFEKKIGEKIILIPIKVGENLKSINEKDLIEFADEKKFFSDGIISMVKEIFKKLKLIVFYTSGSDEVRGWLIKEKTMAVKAAGEIHSDFTKNFIKAEICDFESYCNSREKNKTILFRIEGKEYEINDGDVVFFKVGA